jgi:hypothetical protein
MPSFEMSVIHPAIEVRSVLSSTNTRVLYRGDLRATFINDHSRRSREVFERKNGDLQFRPFAPIRSFVVTAHVHPSTDADAYFAREETFETALKQLNGGQSARARETLERLSTEDPRRKDYLAAACWARFISVQTEDERTQALSLLEKNLDHHTCSTESLVYLGKMRLALGKTTGAIEVFNRALDREPARTDIESQLAYARRKRNQRTPPPRTTTWTALLGALLAFVVVYAVLSQIAIRFGLGAYEMWFRPFETPFGFRLAFIAAAGALGVKLLWRDTPMQLSEWLLDKRSLGVAVATGVTAGVTLARFELSHLPNAAGVEPAWGTIAALIVVTLLVLAEETFFRAYVGRALASKLIGVATPAFFGGILYGIYQLTYHFAAGGDASTSHFGRIAIFTAFVGIPAAFVHHHTKSLSAALVCRIAAAHIATIAAVYRIF